MRWFRHPLAPSAQEEIMTALTRILSGIALAGALSIPAFAATSPQGDAMPNGSMLIIWPDGTMARVHIINSSTANAAMQQATQATTPTMVIVEDGHAYLVPDRKMDNGKMMSDAMSDTSTPGVTQDTSSPGATKQ
jgi:alcohol dehydrogenase YqhD (iron-dependent ADH family)